MSERTRKIILWSTVVALAMSLFFLWIKISQKRLESFRGEKFIEGLNLPEIEFPKIEIPEISQEKLQKLYGEEATTTE